MSTLVADLRYAVRVLGRSPSFAFTVVAVLALGIGANTAIFSILSAVLLRPLPFAEPDRLVRLFHVPPQATFPGMKTFPLSPANFYDWQQGATAFERMAMYRPRAFALTGSGSPRGILGAAVGAGFFEILKAQPAQGRVFRVDEDVAGARVVILSHRFWNMQMGAAPDVLGRALQLNGEPYTIVGVMPPGFGVASWFPAAREIWVPLGLTDAERAVRENHNQQVVARLAPGADVAQARSELEVISRRLERAYPQDNAGWGATVVPLQEAIVGEVRATLLMLLAAVGLVLLIACANVGNLLFTRALGRRKEIAVRAALGASRARVFQQLLIEGMVLAFAGGAFGLLLAWAGLRAGATLLASQVPRAEEISIDARVLVFVLGASVLTGLVAGALPALRAGRADLTDALKEGGRGESAVGLRTRRLLVVCEVALSVVLLMGASVMLRSLLALRTVDAGFDPRNVLTMSVLIPEMRYETQGAAHGVLRHGARAPGRPSRRLGRGRHRRPAPDRGGSVQAIVVAGRPELLPRDQPTVQVRAMTPGYLKTMGIAVLRGRDVAANDRDVLVVSQSAARLLWGEGDPLGQRVTLPLMSRTLEREIVGMVADVKQDSLSETAPPTVYYYTHERDWLGLNLVLRTSVPPSSVSSAAVGVIRGIDPEQPVEEVRTMLEVRDELLTSQRLSAVLLGAFASVALLLASVGIYSVLSYIVRGRSREIGIRSALGAQTGDVLRLVMREGMTPAALGIAVGSAAALAASVSLQRLLYGVSASDPLTLLAVGGTLGLVALLASLVPAYRASRLDPSIVLRGS